MSTIEHWFGGRFTTGVSIRRAPVYPPATGRRQHEVPDDAFAAAVSWRDESLSHRGKIRFAVLEPFGVVAGITPFHFPATVHREARAAGKRVRALGGAENHPMAR